MGRVQTNSGIYVVGRPLAAVPRVPSRIQVTYLTVHDGVLGVLHAGVVTRGTHCVGSCCVGVSSGKRELCGMQIRRL